MMSVLIIVVIISCIAGPLIAAHEETKCREHYKKFVHDLDLRDQLIDQGIPEDDWDDYEWEL